MFKLQICCMIVIVFIMCIYFSAKREHSYEHKLFVAILVTTMMNLFFDVSTVYTVNHLQEVPSYLNRILHIFFIASISLVIYMVFLYVAGLINKEWSIMNGKYRWVKFPPVIPIALMCILPMEYAETPKGNYSYGPAPTVTYLVVAYYFVLLTVLLWRYRAHINKKKRNIIILALVIEGSACLCQAFFTHLLVSGFGLTMLCLALFLTVENLDVLLVERLRQERKRAQEANVAKSVFLASMSHEIRTPINGLIGMNEMILRECKQSEIREYAMNTKAAAQTLLSIISDVMDLSKMEAGKMELQPVEYDLSSLLNDVYHIILDRAKKKGLQLKIHVAAELPSVLYGDDVRIRQILLNLLTNAVKYTEKGSVTLLVGGKEEEDGVVTLNFEVKDTGIGIKQENISKLFTAFERVDEIKNRKIEGIGLGLALTKQFLEMMDSQLMVQSEYGNGSTFSFYLDQKIISDVEIGDFEYRIRRKTEDYVYDSRLYAPGASILVVDDNELNRRVFCSLLKESAIQITEAASGKECLEWLKKKSFDMIFLDHMMPEMDGVETFATMKTMKDNRNANIPVIIFTANAVQGAKQRYQEEGFDGFLSKPVDSVKLEKMLEKMLPPKLLLEKPVMQAETDAVTEKADSAAGAEVEQETAPAEELPYIDGIDWQYARMHIDDTALLVSIAKDFAAEIPAEMARIQKLAQELDTQEGLRLFQTKVHALKSSSAMIGIMSVSSFARALEYAAEAGDREKIHTLLPVLEEELAIYKERLGIFLPEESGKGKEMMEDISVILAMLEMLRLAVMDVDVDAADAAMEQLNSFSYEPALQEQMDKLRYLVQEIQFEEAQTQMEKMIEKLSLK